MHKALYKRDIIIINVSLIFCCRVNKVAMVSFILGQGADINKEFENGDRFEIIFNGFNWNKSFIVKYRISTPYKSSSGLVTLSYQTPTKPLLNPYHNPITTLPYPYQTPTKPYHTPTKPLAHPYQTPIKPLPNP